MAVSSRSMTRQRDYSRLFIALAVVAGVIALAPIVAAIAGVGGTKVGPKTAYATAPAGEYLVLGRTEGQVDIISVARRGSTGSETEIVRVPHIDGYGTVGTVSPGGDRVALVAVDGGTASHPVANLTVVDLETGRLVRAAENIATGTRPVWSPDGNAVVITRQFGGDSPTGQVELLQVSASGTKEELLHTFSDVLGAYPVGFDSNDHLVTVVLDGNGTSLFRDDANQPLSPNLTRDWQLSPDGKTIAYVEVNTSNGVQYLSSTASLDGGGVSAQALTASVSALGVAWNPATNAVSFGVEPGSGPGNARVQALSAASNEGFDVPMAFSESGQALVVTHWTGDSFQEPGRPQLQLVDNSGRIAFDTQTRFFGWASR
ncbi:MAG: TolB family protein [Dehalococcoidia bacterium]